MTKANIDGTVAVRTGREENNATKAINVCEERKGTNENIASNFGLDIKIRIATSLNEMQSSSNRHIPDFQTDTGDGSLHSESVDIDKNPTNSIDSTTATENGIESTDKVIGNREHVPEVDKDELLSDNDTGVGEDKSLKNAPIDRGWAWVILFAGYLEILIFGGFMKCGGIFFITFQERFKSSASQTSLALTIQNMTLSIAGIFVMTVGMKYMSARTSILVGALLQTIFYVVTAFAENFGVLYFTYGFVPGLAGAMVHLPIVSTINTYFTKYRGVANSIFTSGSSLGGLIFGPIYTALIQEYSYTGTFLFVSGFFFNIMITGVLMRPIEFYTKHSKKDVNDIHDYDETKEKLIGTAREHGTEGVIGNTSRRINDLRASLDKDSSKESAYASEDDIEFQEEKFIQHGVHSEKIVQENKRSIDDEQAIRDVIRKGSVFRDINRSISYDSESFPSRHFPSPSLKRAKQSYHGWNSLKKTSNEAVDGLRKRTFSENSPSKAIHGMIEAISRSRVAIYTSGELMYNSLANISVADHDKAIAKRETTALENESKSKSRSNSRASNLGRIVTDFFKTVFDISLFRSFVFIHFLCMAFLILPGSLMPSVYFAPYAKDIGLTSSQIGTLFPIIGCLDMIMRISVGFIADKKWMRSTSILCLYAIIVGTMCHLIRFFTSYGAMIVFVVIIGLTGGAYLSLYAVVILEHIGLEQFKGALGWATMCHGVANAIYFPITGALRDETGTYFASFHLIGVTMYLAAALSFLLPYTSRKYRVT